MNIESMRTRSYRSFAIDDAELPAAARERLLAIRRYDELRAAGCGEQAALKEIGVGSEFMAEFEDACRDLGIELHVLPPRRPQWNGRVERANRTARIEFWNFLACELTVEAVSRELPKYEFFYNFERPLSLDKTRGVPAHIDLALRRP